MAEKDIDLQHDPVNGKIEINVNPTFSEATIIVSPHAFGGIAVTEDDILSELKARGIVYGIDRNIIKNIIKNELFNIPYRVAAGLAPVNGIDGIIKFNYEKKVENIPKEDEKGFVNYKDLGIIRNIKSGTVIAEITPPTDGTPGITILDAPIQQRKGAAVNTVHGENVGLSGDGTKMLALTDGNLKCAGDKFSIEKVFNMRGNVDMTTGNLDFIGDIIIKGEVSSGFKVSSQKSVTIYENVTGATVEAGGDVIIKKGCINSTVISHGNVSIDFVENSNITCDGDLKADAFIMATTYCGGELTASGSKGFLMGGKYTCLKNLTANSIGTKSYGSTIITVGDNAIMLNEKTDCIKRIDELDLQILRCTQAIDFLTQKKKELGSIPPERVDMLNNSIKQRILNQVERKKVVARIAEIEKYLENKQNLCITCRKELYPGTRITINDFVFMVKDKYQYCKIYLGEDGIKTETL